MCCYQASAICNSFPATQAPSRVGCYESWCYLVGVQYPHWVSQSGVGSGCPMHVASDAQQSLLRPTITTITLFLTLPLTITHPPSSDPFPHSQPGHLCGNEVGFLLTPGSSKEHLRTCVCRSQLSLLRMHSYGCRGWWQGHNQHTLGPVCHTPPAVHGETAYRQKDPLRESRMRNAMFTSPLQTTF